MSGALDYRQARLRHQDGARGRIEIVAEVAALVLLDQRLQGSVLGQGRRGHGAAASHGGSPQKCTPAEGAGALKRSFGHSRSRIRATSPPTKGQIAMADKP